MFWNSATLLKQQENAIFTQRVTIEIWLKLINGQLSTIMTYLSQYYYPNG